MVQSHHIYRGTVYHMSGSYSLERIENKRLTCSPRTRLRNCSMYLFFIWKRIVPTCYFMQAYLYFQTIHFNLSARLCNFYNDHFDCALTKMSSIFCRSNKEHKVSCQRDLKFSKFHIFLEKQI